MTNNAKFGIGQVVRHKVFQFRGVVYDVDPSFANSEEWYQSIPEEIRPSRNQPFYHLFAENENGAYEAYVSEQNLLPDETETPVEHPGIMDMFSGLVDGIYNLRKGMRH